MHFYNEKKNPFKEVLIKIIISTYIKKRELKKIKSH